VLEGTVESDDCVDESRFKALRYSPSSVFIRNRRRLEPGSFRSREGAAKNSCRYMDLNAMGLRGRAVATSSK